MRPSDDPLRDPEGREPLRVLLVEDNFFVAIDVQRILESCGCQVVGPVPSLKEGLALAGEEPLSGAILDINILGGTSESIADELGRRGTPFFFITGYGSPGRLPERLRDRPRLHKPLDERALRVVLR